MDNNPSLEQKPQSRLRVWGLCLLSAVLLTLAFPRFDIWILAWFALVPFLWSLDGQRPWGGFKTGFLFGLLFFGGILHWFFHLTSWFSWIAALGVVLLLVYLSLYTAIFGWACTYAQNFPPLRKIFFLPSVWVCLEYLRGHILGGFGWGYLGHTQYENLPVIQVADLTGVYGISFLVMMGNFYLKEIRYAALSARARQTYRVVFYTFFLGVLAYGLFRIVTYQPEGAVKVAVLQGDITQEQKWSSDAWPLIMERYTRLTEEAAQARPALIIWPETALPGFLREDTLVYREFQRLVRRVHTPVLAGTVLQTPSEKYYNTSLLVDGQGNEVGLHHKMHLVPFGEYVPFRDVLPDIVEKLIPIDDFSAGKTYTLFHVDQVPAFNVLICFEDTVPYLARTFTQKGAQFFVNMTNDGWFKDSAAPYMHWQTALFRAVENRRSLVRATNTGVSGIIDPLGRLVQVVQNAAGRRSYVPGWTGGRVALSSQRTFYTKYGNLFTFGCFLCILWGLAGRKPKFFFKE